MTRKITLSLILIVLIFACYEVTMGSNTTIRAKVASIEQLSKSSQNLNEQVARLAAQTGKNYDDKKAELAKVIKEYNEAKDEYDDLVPTTAADSIVGIAETDLKDIYDTAFLLTVVGNYATEEGVDMKMDFFRNTTSASAIQNSASSNFIVCDLKFVVTGKYINLTDFIKDLEDDDRLGFEINDFDMQKSGEDLQITLTVKEVKVNSSDLIETSVTSNSVTSTLTNDPNTTSSNSNSYTNTFYNDLEKDRQGWQNAEQTIDNVTTN